MVIIKRISTSVFYRMEHLQIMALNTLRDASRPASMEKFEAALVNHFGDFCTVNPLSDYFYKSNASTGSSEGYYYTEMSKYICR